MNGHHPHSRGSLGSCCRRHHRGDEVSTRQGNPNCESREGPEGHLDPRAENQGQARRRTRDPRDPGSGSAGNLQDSEGHPRPGHGRGRQAGGCRLAPYVQLLRGEPVTSPVAALAVLDHICDSVHRRQRRLQNYLFLRALLHLKKKRRQRELQKAQAFSFFLRYFFITRRPNFFKRLSRYWRLLEKGFLQGVKTKQYFLLFHQVFALSYL